MAVLSDVTTDTKDIHVRVRNDDTMTDTIGVYVDVIAPGGPSNPYGCTPNGRVIQTTVVLGPGQATNVHVTLTFACADQNGAFGKTYTIVAVADDNADDAGACPPFALQSFACTTAVGNDDQDTDYINDRTCCEVHHS